MKRILTSLMIVVSALLLGGWFGVGDTKDYMDVDTEEYQSVTAKTLGEWKVESYIYNGEEVIGKFYKPDGKLNINFDKKTFSLTLNLLDKVIAEQTPAWQEWEAHKAIAVTAYAITVTSEAWGMFDNNGEPMMSVADLSTKVKAEGSGIPDMDEFAAKEEGKIGSIVAAEKAGSSMGDGSMFGDMVSNLASNVAKDAAEDMVGSADYLKPSVLKPNYRFSFDGDKLILKLGSGDTLSQFTLIR